MMLTRSDRYDPDVRQAEVMQASPRQCEQKSDVLQVVAAPHHDEVHAAIGEMSGGDDTYE